MSDNIAVQALTNERYGPYDMERDLLARIERLKAERDGLTDKAKRAELNKRMRSARALVRWCRTRAGYRQMC